MTLAKGTTITPYEVTKNFTQENGITIVSANTDNAYAITILHAVDHAEITSTATEMVTSESLQMEGFPSGGTWSIAEGGTGTGSITSGGVLTATANGTIKVKYAKDGYGEDIKTITVSDTRSIYWFAAGATDATTAGVAHNATFFTIPTTDRSGQSGNVTLDETEYTLTKRASTTTTQCTFTIPSGTEGALYMAAVSSGSTNHTIRIQKTGDASPTDIGTLTGGSSSWSAISKTGLTAGTYTVTSSGNTRPGMLIMKLSAATPVEYYTVTLNPAGGSIDPVPSGWTLTDGKYIKADVEDGSSVDLLALTTSGYLLDGWKDGESTDYTSPVTIDGADLTLTAQWAQTYAVTYVPNNGVLPAETMTDNNAPYKAGDEVTLLANTFTAPENKEFDEWVATYNDGEVKTLTITAGKFTMPAYPVTVTATWKDACALAPTVSATTLGTTSYTTQVVNCAGISVLGSAGCTISEYGFVYGTATAPTISDNKKALEGDYTVAGTAFPATTLTGLAMNTKYYVRAYATNSFGTAYGAEVEFTTLESLGNVLIVAKNAGQTSDAITALRDNGFLVTVSTPNDSRDYTGIDLVVLDESLDGSLAQTSTSEASTIKGANIPILNLKAFFYTKTNRWNWGAPVNGTATNEIANISEAYCNAESHPIFTGLTIGAGGAIDLIDPAVASGNTLQGVTTNTLVEGKEGYTLATSGDGITFIHELTPAQRGVTDAKYLMVAISNNAKDNLSADGEKLIVNAAKYLIGSTPWTPVLAPATEGIVASPAASYSEGDNISLSITATNVDAATTYTWYKGATLAAAEEAGAIQAAKTIAESGNVYAKASCLAEDAGTYWCVITKNEGCKISASLEVTVLTCTKPGTPANLAATDIAYTTATLGWDAAENANGYKISIVKKSDESVVLDWTACATNSYAASDLTQGTEYTFKVKAVGATGYCEYGLEASKDFTTTAPSVADLVTIADDWTFTPSASIAGGTLAEDNKLFSVGDGNNFNDGGIRIKENRALAFKVAANAKVKATFKTNSTLEMQLGTATSDDDNKAYGHSATSPATFDVIPSAGVVYLTASNDLYLTKLEILYPHTVTYDLNGGTGTLPTQESKYVGETFTAHDGVTGITAPATKEFDKWVDQDAADVVGGTTYTMPAKAVILTAQWKNETVKYSVTYDLSDYTSGVAPTEASKPEGAAITIKAAPARDGYHFLGWLCNIDDATYQAGDSYTMTAALTTFTAQWQQFYVVTYMDGEDELDTEEVNAGSHPAGIANPTKELKKFLGWTLLGEDDLVDPTSLSVATTLYAKWADFDGCAWLSIDREATATLSVGDNVALTTASFGGTVKVANLNSTSDGGSIKYNAKGLYLSGGGKDSIRVTIDHQMQEGTKISVSLEAGGTSARGLKLYTLSGSEITSLGWSSTTTNGAVKVFSYEVPENSPLIGQKAFRLARNNTVYLQYITVEDCAPQDYVVTYKDGETTLGTENVFENGHPTAAGVNTRKNGYVFDGWAETDGGAVVNLSTITITAAKTLYAKYTARVCPTYGKIFSLNMDKTVSTEVNVKSGSINLDGYATISGGTATLANTSNDTRAKVTTTPSIRFSDGNQGYLQVDLDCPILEGDIIRYVNTNSGTIGVRTAHGTSTNETTLDGNKSDITTVEVNAALDGLYTIFVERKSNTSDLKYFEIYRRPVLTGVSLNELTVRVNAVANPEMTLTPSNDAIVTAQAWSIVSGSDKITIDPATGAVTGVAAGDAVIKVILNGDAEHFSATATVHVVNDYARQDVTGSMEWNWANNGPLSGVAAHENNNETETLLANIGTMPNNAEFRSDMLVTTCQHAYRSGTGNGCWQGTEIKFYTTVPGAVKVNYMGTGSSDAVTVSINNWSNTYTGNWTDSKTVVVPAGWVTISASESNKLRIKTITFTAAADLNPAEALDEAYYYGGYTRNVNPQYYGTICLPKAGVIAGATLFELAYMDYKEDNVTPYKVYYDEVLNGELEAGMPYIFLAHESTIGVFYTDDAEETDAKDKNGLHGTLVDIPSGMNGTNVYMLYNNQVLHSTNSGSYLNANRAYIQLNEVPGYGNPGYRAAPAKPGRRRISTGFNAPQIATGLEDAAANETPVKVLINGELYILRGEKMYDATGRLVK